MICWRWPSQHSVDRAGQQKDATAKATALLFLTYSYWKPASRAYVRTTKVWLQCFPEVLVQCIWLLYDLIWNHRNIFLETQLEFVLRTLKRYEPTRQSWNTPCTRKPTSRNGKVHDAVTKYRDTKYSESHAKVIYIRLGFLEEISSIWKRLSLIYCKVWR